MKKVSLVTFSLCLLVAVVYSQNTEVSMNRLTKQQWAEDLDFVVDKLNEVHPGLYRRISPDSLSIIIRNAKLEIENSSSDVECYFAIREIIAALQDGHTNLSIRGKIDFIKGKVPIQFDYFNDGYHVIGVEKGNKELLGLKLIAINGVPVENIIHRFLEVSSGDNRIGRLGKLRSYLTYPLMLQGAGVQITDDEINYKFITKDGNQFSKTIACSDYNPADLYSVQDLLGSETPLHLKNQQKNYWFEYIKSNKAMYVQINRIENQSTKDLFSKFSYEFFDYIDKHSDEVENVIIDLRYNAGGQGRLAISFAKEIIKRGNIDTRGKLFVILGQKTFSAAIVLATSLLEYTDAIFVGSQSACPANLFSDSQNVGNLPNSEFGLSVASRQIDNAWISNREYFKIDIPAITNGFDYFSGQDPALNAIQNKGAIPLEDIAALKGADSAYIEYKVLVQKYSDILWWSSSVNLESNLNAKADKLVKEGKIDQAEQVMVLNTMIYPSSGSVWYMIAQIYYLNGKKDQCIKALEKSLELNPNNQNAIDALNQLKK
ncbi:MAG: tetratricopeptide repeat protein [Bacteroidetes bacterium]|nr:tetratricopeptide repeat protein [Bacteroidota bacterium]